MRVAIALWLAPGKALGMSAHETAALHFTYDYVASHARGRPRDVALLLDGSAIDFATLHQDARAATWAVASLGLRPGSLVAVGLEAFYPQLLALLALERLGLVAVSFLLDEGEAVTDLLTRADLTLMFDASLALPARVRHVLPPDWLEAAAGHEPTLPPALPGDAPVRVARSSGTTGRPKLIEITRTMAEVRVACRAASFGIGRRTRYLATMHLGAHGSLITVMATLRAGGLVVSETAMSPLRAIRLRNPTLVHVLPYHLAEILAEMTRDGLSPDDSRADLKLVVGGAKLSPELRDAAARLLCREVMATYGSNETGNMCRIEPDGVAHVVDGTELEVVDAHGDVVPHGAVGEVRVRGPGVARAYVGNATASAKVFRDGWCYLGDHALALAPGSVRLLGRRDDVLNIGGLKYSAGDLEAGVMQRARAAGIALSDVALMMGGNHVGHPILVVCAAGLPDSDAVRLATALRATLPGHFTIRSVTRIPRSAGGKVRRNDLAGILAAASEEWAQNAAAA